MDDGISQDKVINGMRSKFLVSLLGSVIVAFSIYFIAVQLSLHKESLLAWRPGAKDIIMLGLSSIIYALANYLLAFAWIYLLGSNGEPVPIKTTLIGIYGKSQIAKYIPGNVLHIGGRHLLGLSAGLTHKALAFAALYEITGLLSAAMLISLIGLQWFKVDIAALKWLPFLSPALIVGYLIFPSILSRFSKRLKIHGKWHQLTVPLFIYLGFFLFAGFALLLLLLDYSTDRNLTVWVTALTAFAVAWSVGFVTPGAPSGIGIRESILIVLISPLIGADHAIILAFLFRLVTVIGDLLFMVLTGIGVNLGQVKMWESDSSES